MEDENDSFADSGVCTCYLGSLHVQPRGLCKRKFECPLSWTGRLKKGGSLISESGSLRVQTFLDGVCNKVKQTYFMEKTARNG